MMYLNKNNDKVLTEKEYNELIHRENLDAWENNLNNTVEEFKEDGETFEDYCKYVSETSPDPDFEQIEGIIYLKDNNNGTNIFYGSINEMWYQDKYWYSLADLKNMDSDDYNYVTENHFRHDGQYCKWEHVEIVS